MGKIGVETACSLAACCFNDGVSSLAAVSDHLQLANTSLQGIFEKKSH